MELENWLRLRFIRSLPLLVLLVLMTVWPVLGQDEDRSPVDRAAEVETPEFGKLPWSDQQDQLGDLPARRLTHARGLLSLLGIDESQLAGFADGEPLGIQDEETVRRILYSIPRIPLSDLDRWTQPTEKLSALLSAPNDHRADTFLIQGRTTRIERVAILPEAIERLGFEHYFRVHADIDASPHAAVLCCREIPDAWASGHVLGEPIRAYGLFLKLGPGDASRTELAFATPHIGWLPSEPNATTGVTTDLAYLASLGMDISLFDDVRPLNRKPVTQADRECFYQLLATFGKSDADAARSHTSRSVELAPLLQQPETQHGRLMIVRGTARRAMRIRVDDQDIRERFGIDLYYQIDIFIRLGDQVVRLGKQGDAESPTFTNSYPVTVCVLQLPPDLPEGTDIREEVSIPAACFKLWAYRSRFVSAYDQKQLQVSPMFIGVEPRVIHLDTSHNLYTGLAVAGGFVTLLAFAWIALWRSGKNDAKFKRTRVEGRGSRVEGPESRVQGRESSEE